MSIEFLTSLLTIHTGTEIPLESRLDFYPHLTLISREKALEAYQKERQKRREKEEIAREKFREGIRQKYGIKTSSMDSPDKSTQVKGI